MIKLLNYTQIWVSLRQIKISLRMQLTFNYLSGYSTKPEYNKLIVAPYDIRDVFIDRIDKEIRSHLQHGNGKIMMKMNS